ncbi:MAG: NAD(P)/FAD-dependent oxidoreductase [Candidatus Altiarchaeota archaeon]|nr:NAD(P)/FAD-dependent oxidoreductase [Candidatus Altiarchaeota archaeon]
MIECDVLVVGAGPAGSSAARACALNGLKTVLIDKRPEIGYPVRCAEGIGRYLFPFMPFRIPEEQLVWRMNGMEFWAEDITIRRTGVMWQSYTVNRRSFDKWLCSLATCAGASLITDAELMEFEFGEGQFVKKAVIESEGRRIEIKPKVVIGADGCESTVLRLLGKYKPAKEAIAEVYSWEMNNLDLISPDYEQVFVGDFTATGYAYVFPMGKHRANVGVGCASPKKPMEDYFNEFMELPEMKHQAKNARRVEDKGGKANILKISDKWVYGNVLLTGDAADQNFKPFVEGILPAIICGDMAGKMASKNIGKGEPLENYSPNIMKKLGPLFEQSNKSAKLIYDLFEMNQPKEYLLMLLLLADISTADKIKDFKDKDYNTLRDTILEWNNWHKQTIANTQEMIWYRYVELKEKISEIWK